VARLALFGRGNLRPVPLNALAMNSRLEFQGKVKEKWGKLTDDDLTAINGKRDQLVDGI
jgi:hypothetical protein